MYYIYRKCRNVYNIIYIHKIYNINYYIFLCIYIYICMYTFSYVIFLLLGNNITWLCHHTWLFFVPLGGQQCRCCEGPLGCARGAVWAGKPHRFPETVTLHETSCSVASSSITLRTPASRLRVTAEEQKVLSAHGLQLGVRSVWKQFWSLIPTGFPSGIRFHVFILPWIVGVRECM